MKFSDIFVPRWQNSNPEIRKKAVARLKDIKLLEQIGDLVVHLLALFHQALDLLVGVDHRRVIASSEQPSDGGIAQVGELAEDVHRFLARGDEWTLAALALQLMIWITHRDNCSR